MDTRLIVTFTFAFIAASYTTPTPDRATTTSNNTNTTHPQEQFNSTSVEKDDPTTHEDTPTHWYTEEESKAGMILQITAVGKPPKTFLNKERRKWINAFRNYDIPQSDWDYSIDPNKTTEPPIVRRLYPIVQVGPNSNDKPYTVPTTIETITTRPQLDNENTHTNPQPATKHDPTATRPPSEVLRAMLSKLQQREASRNHQAQAVEMVRTEIPNEGTAVTIQR